MGLARDSVQIPMRSYDRCQLSSCISTCHQFTITAVVVDYPLCGRSIQWQSTKSYCRRGSAAWGCEMVAVIQVASELAAGSRPRA